MTGYVVQLSNDGTSGVITPHGDLPIAATVRYSFYNYTGTPLKVQARVTFDASLTAGNRQPSLAVNIVWDGQTYDVPPNQVVWYQP